MRKHPECGWAILWAILGFERASLLVLHHHECFDGSGYPARLAGERRVALSPPLRGSD